MNERLIQQTTRLQQQVDGLAKPEKTIVAIDPFLKLPGLVGFWPMSSVQRSTGDAYDLSGQGRTLTYNGNPTYNIYNSLIPYIDFDGTGDFLTRATETDLDITGIEAIYSSSVQGLTLGGWFWADAFTATHSLIGKWNTGGGGNRSYLLETQSATQWRFLASSTGADFPAITHNGTFAASAWHFVVGRWNTTNIGIFIDGTLQEAATGIASIFQGNSNFTIGARHNAGTNPLDGRAALCFLCANSLSDALIGSLFQQTRVLFGV